MRSIAGPLIAVMLASMLTTVCVKVAAGEANAVRVEHPVLLYSERDRQRLLKVLRGDKPAWEPSDADKSKGPAAAVLYDFWKAGYERHLLPSYLWEGPRSEAMLRLAIVTWVEPGLKRPENKWQKLDPAMATLLAVVRSGVKSVSVPEGRKGDGIKGPGGTDQWARILESSTALWHYAVAFDMLAAPHVRDAGLEPAVLDEMYRKLADGVFHILVEHMRSVHPTDAPRYGNNWTGRELAGIGMTCLALRDRLESEPTGSQRRRDFEDGLRLVREFSKRYMEGWAALGDERGTYYYEGPHYLRYWVDTFLPFAVAHGRMFPETKERWPFLSLEPTRPLSRFLHGHMLAVGPTHVDKEKHVQFGPLPFDDAWLYPEDAGVPFLMAAAWLGDHDEAAFLNLAKYCGTGTHPLLLAHPILDAYAKHELAPLPPVFALPRSGVALARTGSGTDDLMVAIKNAWTQRGKDGETPSTWGHCHSDNGQVVAYRGGEPILVDPGYGSEGFANPHHEDYFNNWNRHNVLLVEDPPGYPADIRKLMGDDSNFVLPAWKDAEAPARRITRCEEVRDAIGSFQLLETETPKHFRTVVMPAKNHLLVIDRLKEPRRIKLAWWGNGSVEGRENVPDAKGNRLEGDTGKVATARIEPSRAEAIFFRGPSFAVRVRVVAPATQETKLVAGEQGIWWYKVNMPLTGMHVTSKEPVRFAVTLIEIAEKPKDGEARFQLNAEATAGADGNLESIKVSGGDLPVTYTIAPDGLVKRSR